jgi:hypothetical protein
MTPSALRRVRAAAGCGAMGAAARDGALPRKRKRAGLPAPCGGSPHHTPAAEGAPLTWIRA